MTDTPKDLDVSETSMNLKSHGNNLPGLRLNLRYIEGEIINLKWNWNDDAKKPKKYQVPNDFIDTSDKKLSGNLSDVVQIDYSNNSMKIKFRFDKTSSNEFYSINGFAFDDYINWINSEAITESGDNFRGIFGLGQRANT